MVSRSLRSIRPLRTSAPAKDLMHFKTVNSGHLHSLKNSMKLIRISLLSVMSFVDKVGVLAAENFVLPADDLSRAWAISDRIKY